MDRGALAEVVTSQVLTLFLDLGERLSNEETFPKYTHPWNI